MARRQAQGEETAPKGGERGRVSGLACSLLLLLPPFPLPPTGYLSHQEPLSNTGREETYHTYLHMEARRRAPSCPRME